MGWFAAAMLLFALFVGNNARHLPTDPVWLEGTRGWYLVVLSGIACLGAGLTATSACTAVRAAGCWPPSSPRSLSQP